LHDNRKGRKGWGEIEMDKKTESIAAEWIAKYDEAMMREDLAEMMRIIDVVSSHPNRPFKEAILRQLEA